MSTLADLEDIRKSLVQQYKNKFELIQMIPNSSFAPKEDVGCSTSTPSNNVNLGTAQPELQTFESCKLLAANSGSKASDSFFSLVENTPEDSTRGLFQCYISDTNPKLAQEFKDANPLPEGYEQNVDARVRGFRQGAPGGVRMQLDENGDVGLYNSSGNLVKNIFKNGTRYDCNSFLSRDDAIQYQNDKFVEINEKYPVPAGVATTALVNYNRTNLYWKTMGCPAGDKPSGSYRLVFKVVPTSGYMVLYVEQISTDAKGWKRVRESTGKNHIAMARIPADAIPYFEYAKLTESASAVPIKVDVTKDKPLISDDHRFAIFPNDNGNVVLKYFTKTCDKTQNGYTYTQKPSSAYVYKTSVYPEMNKMFYNNGTNSLQYVPFTDENIQLSASYTNVGPFAPTLDQRKNAVDIANEQECLDKCTSSENCGHVYFYGPNDGTKKCAIGEASKNGFIPTSAFRPSQLEKDLLSSSMYVRNRQVNPSALVGEDEAVQPVVVQTLEQYNQYAAFNKVYDQNKVQFGLQGETPYIDVLNKLRLIHDGPTVEGFDTSNCSTATANVQGCSDHILNRKLTPLKKKISEIDNKQAQLSGHSVSIQKNIAEFDENIRAMKKDGKTDKYEFLGIWNEPKTVANGIKEDSKTLMETQANLTVLSTLACASMLVAAIMISS